MAKKPAAEKDEDGAEAGKAEGGKGLLGNRKLLIAVAGVVLLAGAGAGATVFLSGGDEPSMAAADGEPQKTAFFYDLPVMIVNLSSIDNRTAYVKLEVSLELPEQSMVDILQPNMPRVLDAFQTYLRELRPSDLSGSAGLFRLKEELQRRVNIAVYPARVDDVLFRNVVIQ